MNMEKSKILLKVNENEFEKLKNDMISKYGIEISDNEKIAMSVILRDKSFIFINKDEYDGLDEDYQFIIIAHEYAHCSGIKGEEDADKWALEVMKKSLNKSEAVKKLLDMWKYRHGHEYQE